MYSLYAERALALSRQTADKWNLLQGRPLRQGDLIPLGAATSKAAKPRLEVPHSWRATFAEKGKTWQVGVLPGPNADPDYFTPEDIATFYSSQYKVHYNS